MNDKIIVWLKAIKRPQGIEFVKFHIDYWLNQFKDKEKYKIIIYNENNEDLYEIYKDYEIINKFELLKNPRVFKIKNIIDNYGIIDPMWKGAAFGLTSPYFYYDNKYIINIDACDSYIEGDGFYYIEKALELLKDKNLFTISLDYYQSYHNEWSFGVNISETKRMKDIILKCMYKKVPVPGWKTNIDYLLTLYLKNNKVSPTCFITPSKLVHCGLSNQTVKFDEQKKKVEVFLHGKTYFKNLHPCTVLVK